MQRQRGALLRSLASLARGLPPGLDPATLQGVSHAAMAPLLGAATGSKPPAALLAELLGDCDCGEVDDEALQVQREERTRGCS